MSARPTGEIVAALRDVRDKYALLVATQAANRLEELETETDRLAAALSDFMRMQTRLQRERDTARAEVDRLQGMLFRGLQQAKAGKR